MPSYREIRTSFQVHPRIEPVLVDHYAKFLSPLFTKVFLRLGTTPNQVTVLMMLSGILGGCLFALPGIWIKAAGIVFIHVWYVLDCSDGEVARITRRFSPFGKEIDYTAHIIDHPVFNLAFAITLLQTARHAAPVVLFVAILGISAELVLRNIMSFYIIRDLKIPASPSQPSEPSNLKSIFVHFVNAFTLYPNFALAFPLCHLIDHFMGTNLAFPYLCFHTGLSTLVAIRSTTTWVKRIVAA